MNYRKEGLFKQELPIDEFLPEVVKYLKVNSSLVLSAEPGAGKTTRLPAALLNITNKKILILEPRRIAAVSASLRVAEENGWTLGGSEVGYQVRFDSKVTSETRLIYLTEALLGKRILEDPDLSDVGAVVLDEFHERSLHVDLAIGLLKELQTLSRPDLKIVVMSATLNHVPLCDFLETQKTFSIPGKLFPLEIEYLNTAQKLQTDHVFIDSIFESIKKTLSKVSEGEHILVFLPGVGEIERVADRILQDSNMSRYSLHRLHGQLSIQEQKAVLSPLNKTKIILSTNVAESSLTIDGVTAVIDSGLQRRSHFNSKTGAQQLMMARISSSSATQRAGRAARQKSGYCLRLWSKLEQQALPKEDIPEIQRSDLSETILLLARLGVTEPLKFSWFETPKIEKFQNSIVFLKLLGALDSKGHLTNLGQNISSAPCGLRSAIVLENAILLTKTDLYKESKDPQLTHINKVSLQLKTNPNMQIRFLSLTVALASILNEARKTRKTKTTNSNNTFPTNSKTHQWESDLWDELENAESIPLFNKTYFQLSRFLEEKLKIHLLPWNQINLDEDLHQLHYLLIAFSFKDRLTRRRAPQSHKALMVGGRGLALDESSRVKTNNYFISLDLVDINNSSDTRCSSAVGIPESLVFQLGEMRPMSEVFFNDEKGSFLKKTYQSLILAENIHLPIGNEHIQAATLEEIGDQICEVAPNHWNYFLKKNEELQNWHRRLEFFEKVTDQVLLTSEVIKASLTEAAYSEKSLEAISQKNLIYFFENQLNQDVIDKLNQNCPIYFEAPTGSRLKIQYNNERPELHIRLQELFGQKETPSLFQGKWPLTLVLLGPHYRPIQVTQDLVSFWKNAYIEVKKELKTRYPKHSWPEDPFTAIPVAKGRSQK